MNKRKNNGKRWGKGLAVLLAVLIVGGAAGFPAAAAGGIAQTAESAAGSAVLSESEPGAEPPAEPAAPVWPLIDRWLDEGFPEDVGGVGGIFRNDGTPVYWIYVVEGTTEARKAELAALAGDTAAEFRTCRWSYGELSELGHEILVDYASGGEVWEAVVAMSARGNGLEIRILPEEFDRVAAEIAEHHPGESEKLTLRACRPGELSDGDGSLSLGRNLPPQNGGESVLLTKTGRPALFAACAAAGLAL
ncbi:MAG: hypothetical protein IJL69_06855, partial [Oscillospiraceae bacterium]|nr:hypothetical protein [Oscillospiraceae bacterium]